MWIILFSYKKDAELINSYGPFETKALATLWAEENVNSDEKFTIVFLNPIPQYSPIIQINN